MIKINQLNKSFGSKNIIQNLSFDIKIGELVAITGKSGSGKTTLINIIGLLEEYDSGTIEICGVQNPKINSKRGRDLLKNRIGYIFQNFALVEEYTVLENFKLVDTRKGNNVEKYLEALDAVGLKDKINQKVYTLSGGEQQRVAIAKIIYKDVNIILADEPTGSVDGENKEKIMEIFDDLRKKDKTILIVTHDESVAKLCDRVVEL